jgi:cobalt-zinc-cadmium efflux system membrane fusion protein
VKLSHILLLVAATLALGACNEAPALAPEPPGPILQGTQLRFPAGNPQLDQLGVVAAAASKATTVELPARLVWNEERTQRIYAPFAGRVVRIAADVGQVVKRGTLLAQLASPDFGIAQADTAKAQADANLTQKSLQRQRELFDAGIVARKDLDVAEAEAARSHAEIRRAQARTQLYGGAPGAVNQSLALTAGIAGLVVERNLTPGQELRPDQAGPGVPPLFVISDPTSLWVQIDARESEAATLRPGTSFELVVGALPGQVFEGRVTASADAIDASTRTIKVRGLIANPERLLKSEMLATVRVHRSLGSGVLIPAQAVALLANGQHSVMVQVQSGSFEPRDVKLGYQGPREAVVTQGLDVGELVVSENVLLLARQYRLAMAAAYGKSGAAARPAASAARTAASGAQ